MHTHTKQAISHTYPHTKHALTKHAKTYTESKDTLFTSINYYTCNEHLPPYSGLINLRFRLDFICSSFVWNKKHLYNLFYIYNPSVAHYIILKHQCHCDGNICLNQFGKAKETIFCILKNVRFILLFFKVEYLCMGFFSSIHYDFFYP